MAAFFGLFGKPKMMFHEELPARERIVSVLQDHIVPDMEARGFTFNEKKVIFKRDRGDQFDEIDHNIHRRNSSPGWVQFYPFWKVESRSYARWLQEHMGKDKDWGGTVIHGTLEDLSLHDERMMDVGWFDLAKTDNKKLVDHYNQVLMQELVPLMDSSEDLRNILAYERTRGHHDTPRYITVACMLGDMAEAQAALARYEQVVQRKGNDPGMMRTLEEHRRLVEKFS